MRRIPLLVLLLLMLPAPALAQENEKPPMTERTMTYEEAVASIPERALPAFWVGHVDGLAARLDTLVQRGNVRAIAVSPSGWPLHLVTYGEREDADHRANFNSAVGGNDPSAYMDKAAREKPVILLVGPVHGQETSGLTGLVNFIRVMETGKDLLGRDQRELQQLGKQARLLIIPAGNPDGIARFEPRTLYGMTMEESHFWGTGTWSDDTFVDWPYAKLQHPMTGENVGFMGCYFNDIGVNPMHDEFLDPMSTEAPAILRVAKEAGPDYAVSLHSCECAPHFYRPAYMPRAVQQDVQELNRGYNALLEGQGLPTREPFEVEPEQGTPPDPFNLSSAIYHISGAHSFLHENPRGLKDGPGPIDLALKDLLDTELLLYEAMLRHALKTKEGG